MITSNVRVVHKGQHYESYSSELLGDILVNRVNGIVLIPERSAANFLNVARVDPRYVAHIMDTLECSLDPEVSWVWDIEYEGALCPRCKC